MTIQITIVGLGQIGGSMGLALAAHKEQVIRVGHDRHLEVARQAERMGAIDRVEFNLPTAVRGADLVLLTLPVDQIRATLEIIAPDLKAGAVVMDTAPAKEAVANWAAELLPKGRFYVGLTPVLNPAYLHGTASKLQAAHADLFQNGLLAITAPPRASSEAIKLATDLAGLLGASPMFADLLEIDGLMAATDLLPALLAAALVHATLDQPGWRDGRKIAGRAYATASGPIAHFQAPKALASTALLNRQAALRVIDRAMAALQALRADIETRDADSLETRLEQALTGRDKWWQARQAGDWVGEEGKVHMPGPASSEFFGRLFGLGLGRKSRGKGN